jgi:hypothetical protein
MMAASDRVLARLRATGMSTLEAQAAVDSVAAAGYTLVPRSTSSPAALSAGRTSWVRALAGRSGATVHAVSAGEAGWMIWVELPVKGGGVRRLAPVFAAGDGTADPFA